MFKINLDDYSLNKDEELVALIYTELFDTMGKESARQILDITLRKHELSVSDFIVMAASMAYTHAMTQFVTGEDELGIVVAHQMEDITNNAETYAQSEGLVKFLWECLNQLTKEESVS